MQNVVSSKVKMAEASELAHSANASPNGAHYRRFYYGWVIVAVAALSMAFWFGIRSSFSVFYVALLEDFSWSRGGLAGVQSAAMITYTLAAPLLGSLIDRFGPRRIILPGIVVLTLGLILCATAETLTQFYLLYGLLVGSGVACIGIVCYSAILVHWFEKKRGLASGIAVSGMGLGVLLLVPLSQYFISVWGWRTTFVLLAGLGLIGLMPLNGLFLRHKPRQVGQSIDGNNIKANGAQSGSIQSGVTLNSDWTFAQFLNSSSFWCFMAFSFCATLGVYIVLVHNVKYLVDLGIPKMTAAAIFAMVGVISSIFRIIWGWVSDQIGREMTYTLGIICACAGVGALLMLETSGMPGLVYLFPVFFGIGWGVTAPMVMSGAADIFNGRIFGLLFGIVEGVIGLAGAFGAWLAGFIFDRTQSYHWAFVIAIVSIMLSCLFLWLAAPRKNRPAAN
jgi:MFS family permease